MTTARRTVPPPPAKISGAPVLCLPVEDGGRGWIRWGDLSPAQLAQIDELQRRTVADEDGLSREMAQVQEGHGAVAAGWELDVDGLVGRVGAVFGRADALRLRTMKRAVEKGGGQAGEGAPRGRGFRVVTNLPMAYAGKIGEV